METITLATGEIVDITMCTCDPVRNILYISLPDYTFSNASMMFENPQNTVKITYGITVYENFTHLTQIKDENGNIRVNLEATK